MLTVPFRISSQESTTLLPTRMADNSFLDISVENYLMPWINTFRAPEDVAVTKNTPLPARTSILYSHKDDYTCPVYAGESSDIPTFAPFSTYKLSVDGKPVVCGIHLNTEEPASTPEHGCFIYDPDTNLWAPVAFLTFEPPIGAQTAQLEGDRWLLVGGAAIDIATRMGGEDSFTKTMIIDNGVFAGDGPMLSSNASVTHAVESLNATHVFFVDGVDDRYVIDLDRNELIPWFVHDGVDEFSEEIQHSYLRRCGKVRHPDTGQARVVCLKLPILEGGVMSSMFPGLRDVVEVYDILSLDFRTAELDTEPDTLHLPILAQGDYALYVFGVATLTGDNSTEYRPEIAALDYNVLEYRVLGDLTDLYTFPDDDESPVIVQAFGLEKGFDGLCCDENMPGCSAPIRDVVYKSQEEPLLPENHKLKVLGSEERCELLETPGYSQGSSYAKGNHSWSFVTHTCQSIEITFDQASPFGLDATSDCQADVLSITQAGEDLLRWCHPDEAPLNAIQGQPNVPVEVLLEATNSSQGQIGFKAQVCATECDQIS